MWRSGQKCAVCVSSLVLLAAECFIRPHTLALATGFPVMHHSKILQKYQSVLDLRPLQEPMSEGFLGAQGGPEERPPLSLSAPSLLWGSCTCFPPSQIFTLETHHPFFLWVTVISCTTEKIIQNSVYSNAVQNLCDSHGKTVHGTKCWQADSLADCVISPALPAIRLSVCLCMKTGCLLCLPGALGDGSKVWKEPRVNLHGWLQFLKD